MKRGAWACLVCVLGFAVVTGRGQEATPSPPRVGVLTDNYPYSFRGPEGRIEGFAFELVQEVERVMGLRFERVEGTTAEINPSFRAGQLELLQSYAHFPERENEADFSFPYLTMMGTIFVRGDDARIKTFADLRGRKVLVHRGSQGESVLRRAGLEDSIAYVSSVEEGLKGLARGEGDATLATRLSGLALSHHLGLKNVRALDTKLVGFEVRYCIAVKEGDRELLARVNEGLAILVRTGRFDELYQKWFGHLAPAGYTAEQVKLGVAVSLGVALIVAVWAMLRQARLRRRIAKQAEALRASEERHREIFEGANDGLLVLEREAGGGEWRLRQANPAAVRLFGASALPEGGAGLRAFFAADLALADKLAACVAGSASEEFEYERAGGECWLRVTVSSFGERKLITLVDITEQTLARRKLQQQEEHLRRTQKLEAVGTLASGIAHDFNNVLTAIVGNAELGLIELPANHPAVESQRQVLRAAGRARDLVRQILAFSRQTDSSRRPMSITPVVEEAIAFLRSVTRGTVDYEHVRCAALPQIVADAAQVHQVLMNIGTNAVQAMRGRDGRLVVREELLTMETAPAPHPTLPPGRYVCIGIQDTGSGMSPAVLERIFEPFFTTKAPGEGTGLGLAVVHGIMQQHSGAVTVSSQPGRGTLFRLYFPAAAPEPKATNGSSADAPPPRGTGELVLLVDDDRSILEPAQLILQRLGYRVAAHQLPEAALADFASRAQEFSLVVSDLAMPRMTGLQLAKEILTLRPGLAFLLTSGNFSEEARGQARALGIARLLPKPFTVAALASEMAAQLGKGR